MGGGTYSSASYTTRSAAKAAAGIPTFDHDARTRSLPRSQWQIHELLDPQRPNARGDHAGRNIREALDSDEHPNSTPVAVFFDVTASMGALPEAIRQALPRLFDQLNDSGVVEDPQVLVGAIGDAYSDPIPLQVGQFESSNVVDEQIEKIIRVGGGGGGNHESYELMLYFMARHTYIDSWEKRSKKGHLFIFGDERTYGTVNYEQVQQVIGGDSAQMPENISTERIMDELKEKWNVYFVFVEQSPSYTAASVIPPEASEEAGWSHGAPALSWGKLLGENALTISDVTRSCDLIARTVSVAEGTNIPAPQ